MTEVIVTPDQQPPEGDSAHNAAVAEGAAAVHSDAAEQASDEAKAAAEAALAVTAANIAAAETAQESAARAETAAEQSQVTLDMLHEALVSQGTAISALTDEIRNSRKESKPAPAEPVTRTSDEPPKSKTPKRRGFIVR